MKKTNIIGMLVIGMMLITLAGIASAKQLPVAEVSVYKYEPAPAQPGNYIDLYISVVNQGTDMNDFKIKLVPEYPYSVASEQTPEVIITSIPDTESAFIKYRVNIDKNAANGYKNISFEYTHSDMPVTMKYEYAIDIRTTGVSVAIDTYDISDITPGGKTKLTLGLKNFGKIGVKNLDATLDLSNTPFATTMSGTKKRIDNIEQGATETIEYEIIADTSAQIKPYKVPLNLQYEDERGKTYTDTLIVSIPVNAKPEVTAVIQSSDLNLDNTQGKVSFKIINKGISDIKQASVILKDGRGYEVISPTITDYLGNLNSDDFETADFEVTTTTDPVFNLEVQFKDAYNNDRSITFALPLKLRAGPQTSYTGTIIFALIIIAGLAYWFMRKKRKNVR